MTKQIITTIIMASLVGLSAQAQTWEGGQNCGACKVLTTKQKYQLYETINNDTDVYELDNVNNDVIVKEAGLYEICLYSVFRNTGRIGSNVYAVASVNSSNIAHGYEYFGRKSAKTVAVCRTRNLDAGDKISFSNVKEKSKARITLYGSNLSYHMFSIERK